MGCFSNGTEGNRWKSENCSACAHNDDEADEPRGCPIWNAHLIYNCDQTKAPALKNLLAMFIPTKRGDVFNDRCKMFHVKLPKKLEEMENGPDSGTA